MSNCLICEKVLTKKQKKYCSTECRILSIKKFGTARFFTDETIKKLSFKRSDETKEKNRLAALSDNCRKEGTFFCNRCDKEFKTNTSLRSHKSTCGHQKENSICEMCDMTFKSKTGLNIHINSMHKKSVEEKQKMSLRMKEAKKDINSKVRKTSIQEDDFFQELTKLFHDVQRNFKINEFYHVYDFFIPSLNLIIEFDGDYWHGNIEKYPALTNRMKKQYHLDANSFEYAIKNQYNIIRLWSSKSTLFLERVSKCLQMKQEKLELNQLEEAVRKEFSILV
jgi:hypothetical protein